MSTQAKVDRGLEIRAAIETLEEELSIIEQALRASALAGDQIDLTDPDRDGKQWLACGTEAVVPVVITADLISASFGDGTPVHARLADVAGDRLTQFYRPLTTWKMLPKNGKAFRLEAVAILGTEAGPRLVTAALARDKFGIPKNQIKVDWDRAEDKK